MLLDHGIAIHFLVLQRKKKWMAIFALVYDVTKLVQNFCALWKLPSKVNTVKRLKKLAQLLWVNFVALVKFPGNGK